MLGLLSPERQSYRFLIFGSLSVGLICQNHVDRKKIWYTLFFKSFVALVICSEALKTLKSPQD